MKTLNIHFEREIRGISFRGLVIIPVFAVALLFTLYSCTTPYMVGQNQGMTYGTPPPWAPNNDNFDQVNYYYLPDIECYYDLRNREFVYIEDGNWRFSASLPSIYASFDLNNCFVVKLNKAVYEPWHHFEYYVAHYPRYYYKSYNGNRDHDNAWSSRWFNENARHSGNNNERANYEGTHRNELKKETGYKPDRNTDYRNQASSPGENRNEKRQSSGSQSDRNSNYNNQATNGGGNRIEVKPTPQPSKDTPRKNGAANRQAQPVKYYGKQIGQPVKVQKNMKKTKENKSEEKGPTSRNRRGE